MHHPSLFIESLAIWPLRPRKCRWRLVGPAGRALCLLCARLIFAPDTSGKCSYLNYPLPQGWLRFWRIAISLFPSLCPSASLLLRFFSPPSLLKKISPFLFLSCCEQQCFPSSCQAFLQRCLKLHKNILVSTNRNQVNKPAFCMSGLKSHI